MTAITVNAAINSSGARTGAAQFNAALGSMRQGVSQAQASLGGLGSSLFSIQGLFALAGGAAGGMFVKSMVAAADSVALLNARLGLVARDGVEASALFNTIAGAAERARTPTMELARIYTRSSNALADMGKSQTQAIAYTETLAKVTKLSGASATEAQAGMLQLTQALVSGRLQGDEFRSVTENLPEVLRILQRESGLTAKELRKLATDGRLSAEMLVNAMLNASKQIEKDFAKLPITASEAWGMLTDQLTRAFGTVANNAGVSKAWADALNAVRATISSPEMTSGFKTVAEGLKSAADLFKSSIQWIKDARIEYQAWTKALGETTGWTTVKGWFADYKTWLDEWNKSVAESNRAQDVAAGGRTGGFASFGKEESFADKIERYKNNLRDVAKWQTTVTHGAAALADAANKGWGKLTVKPGDPDNEEAMRKAQRLLEIMQLQNDMQDALIAGDTVKARAIENELEARQKITDEMRNVTPVMAEQFRATVRITNELERQKKVAEENKQFAVGMTTALTDGIKDAIVAGDSFSDTVRKMAIKMLELVVQTAILAPLAKSIANSFSGFMGGSGISNIFGLGEGGGALKGITDFFMGGMGFAKGGVFDSPVALAGMGGGVGVMAEAGPEAIMPLRRGPDGSLGIAATGGGSSGPSAINIYIQGDATDETVNKMRRVAREELTRGTPGIVKTSVSAVADRHRGDASFLSR